MKYCNIFIMNRECCCLQCGGDYAVYGYVEMLPLVAEAAVIGIILFKSEKREVVGQCNRKHISTVTKANKVIWVGA